MEDPVYTECKRFEERRNIEGYTHEKKCAFDVTAETPVSDTGIDYANHHARAQSSTKD